jgi:phosphomannomutase
MVTASHNPPQDNGYKVYLGDGMQIVPPADADIADAIARATARGPVAGLPHGDDWVTIGDDVLDDYVRKAVALVEPGPPLDLRIAYTPMHGVGGQLFLRVLEEVGFPRPVVVAEQFSPDPAFPTVAFPNPEEPGAMDLALAAAAEHDCDLILANDPDADRCAAGVRTADGWRMLTGDEVGWLLGWWIAVGNRRLTRRGVFAESIVSGSMLKGIAADANLEYEETLTGFKWIARVPDIMFGYEEALGYCVDPNGVRDKDGITAALMIAEMAARLKDKGRTLLDILDELALRHGAYATGQVSIRVDELSRIPAVMERLRSAPPGSAGGVAVAAIDDLERGSPSLPPTDGLRLTMADASRIIVRPSGTEPKVKCYLQAIVDVADGELEAARTEARRRLEAMSADVRRWLE